MRTPRIALDIDDVATPWLSATGGLTTNLEWNNFTILSPSRNLVYSGYAERWRHTRGCGRFFNALRDTTTDQFLATYKVGEARPDMAAKSP